MKAIGWFLLIAAAVAMGIWLAPYFGTVLLVVFGIVIVFGVLIGVTIANDRLPGTRLGRFLGYEEPGNWKTGIDSAVAARKKNDQSPPT